MSFERSKKLAQFFRTGYPRNFRFENWGKEMHAPKNRYCVQPIENLNILR
jgi:hypothetical protein